MPVSVTMPRLGESVTEGTVTRWLKREGDRVAVDEPLLEVSTDKVDTEIPSPAAGVLRRIVVQEDETVDVGSELAVIDGDADETAVPPGPGRGEPMAPAKGPATPQERVVGAARAGAAGGASDDAVAQATPAEPVPPVGAVSSGEPSPKTGPAPSAAGPGVPDSALDADVPVTLPALGESVVEGTVTRWFKREGDAVEIDEPLLEVSTDKVDTELPSPVTGTVVEIKVAEDETVPVGAELAVIRPAGAAAPAARVGAAPGAPSASAAAAAPRPPTAAAAPAVAKPPAAATPTAPISITLPAPPLAAARGEGGYVTPLVRKLAAERGVDLASVRGTGVGGRIRKQDVLDAADRAAEAARAAQAPSPPSAPTPTAPAAGRPQPSPLRGRTEKISRLRGLIARRMVASLQTSAQLTTIVEVDVTRVAKLREQAKAEFLAQHGVKLTFLPFFAQATVEALRVHPSLNASLDMAAGTVTYHDAEHLGIAVDTERGLVVPVIRNAGDLNLAGFARRIADLAERTRANQIGPDDLSGGTFTLTNTGSRGAIFDTPIINQPQVGILGTGAVIKRPAVVDDPDLGEIIAPRSMAYLCLTYDHRLVDGADAARFLGTIKERLEAGHFDTELGVG